MNPKKENPKKKNDRTYKRRGRGRKPAYKKDPAESAATKGPASSINDLSWYAKNPELLASASMFPFPNKPGMSLYKAHELYKDGELTTAVASDRMPGVMRIEYAYSIGYSEDVTSPASIAAKELFGVIRSAFSGSLDEDAPDLLMYCLALDQIHAYIAWMKRLYRTINKYDANNRLTPEYLVQAQFPNGTGISLTDLQENKVLLWNQINTLVNMVNKFSVPMNMDIYNRHRWMNENVYMDNPSWMAQAYVFAPTQFWELVDIGEMGSTLQSVPFEPEAFSDLFAFGKELVSSLSNWEDAYTINGHIMRAFENVPFYKAELLAQDEVLDPVHVEEVLDQIHNLTIIEDYEPGNITQDPSTNAILTPQESYTIPPLGDHVLIDCNTINPTPAEVTIATRLSAVWDSHDQILHRGTEVIKQVYVTTTHPANGSISWIDVNPNFRTLPSGSAADRGLSRNRLRAVMQLGAWRKAPRLFFTYRDEGLTPELYTGWYVGDMTNPMMASAEMMRELHRVCIYSEFNCFAK